jgi:High potential iron-sulfur protein
MSGTHQQGRRTVLWLALGGACLAATGARAQPARVDEADESAAALGYRHDTTKVDAKKYPQHTAAQHCSNCAFWQGGATDAWAGCSMFGRKQIAAMGWCVAWRKP